PCGTKAPKDCPAVPLRVTSMVPSGSSPKRLASSPPSIAPTLRCTLRTSTVLRAGSPVSIGSSCWSNAASSRWSWARIRRLGPANHRQHRRQVQTARLPVRLGPLVREQVGAADRLVDAAQAKRRKVFTHLLGEEEEERLHELRLAGEPLAQHRILGGDPDRA